MYLSFSLYMSCHIILFYAIAGRLNIPTGLVQCSICRGRGVNPPLMGVNPPLMRLNPPSFHWPSKYSLKIHCWPPLVLPQIEYWSGRVLQKLASLLVDWIRSQMSMIRPNPLFHPTQSPRDKTLCRQKSKDIIYKTIIPRKSTKTVFIGHHLSVQNIYNLMFCWLGQMEVWNDCTSEHHKL